MIEGSGFRPGSLTNGSGSGKPINTWILRIRIRSSQQHCQKSLEIQKGTNQDVNALAVSRYAPLPSILMRLGISPCSSIARTAAWCVEGAVCSVFGVRRNLCSSSCNIFIWFIFKTDKTQQVGWGVGGWTQWTSDQYLRVTQGCGSGSGSGSAFIWVAGPGSGSRRAKMTYKYRKKKRIFMFWSAGCSCLGLKGFSCSLCVPYGGLGITKLQFIKKIFNFFQL